MEIKYKSVNEKRTNLSQKIQEGGGTTLSFIEN